MPTCSTCPKGQDGTFTLTVNGRTHSSRACAAADQAGRFGDYAYMASLSACLECGALTQGRCDCRG